MSEMLVGWWSEGELTDDELNVPPEQHPRRVNDLAVGLLDRLVHATKDAAADHSHTDGEAHEQEDARQNNLLAPVQTGLPDDQDRESHDCSSMSAINKVCRDWNDLLIKSESTSMATETM